jgi:hypothetical protein
VHGRPQRHSRRLLDHRLHAQSAIYPFKIRHGFTGPGIVIASGYDMDPQPDDVCTVIRPSIPLDNMVEVMMRMDGSGAPPPVRHDICPSQRVRERALGRGTRR